MVGNKICLHKRCDYFESTVWFPRTDPKEHYADITTSIKPARIQSRYHASEKRCDYTDFFCSFSSSNHFLCDAPAQSRRKSLIVEVYTHTHTHTRPVRLL